MELIRAEEAFDMQRAFKAYESARSRSYRTIEIGEVKEEIIDDENYMKLFGPRYYRDIEVIECTGKTHPYKLSGTRAITIRLYRDEHMGTWLTVEYLLTSGTDVHELIFDDMKYFYVTSKYKYYIKHDGKYITDPRTQERIFTEIHPFIMFSDDSFLRELTKRTRETEWIAPDEVQTTVD